MRNLAEERVEKELLLQQKRKELVESENQLRELINSSKNLHGELNTKREDVSKVRYKTDTFCFVLLKEEGCCGLCDSMTRVIDLELALHCRQGRMCIVGAMTKR